MFKKIKYLIDNLTAQDDQDQFKMSRRSFLFTMSSLIVAPSLPQIIELKERQAEGWTHYGESPLIGAIEFLRYQKEILALLDRKFVFADHSLESVGHGQILHVKRGNYEKAESALHPAEFSVVSGFED